MRISLECIISFEDDLNYVELKTASDQNIVIPKSSSETHDSEDDSNSKLLPNKGEKSSSVYYTKSTKGRKYNPQKKPVGKYTYFYLLKEILKNYFKLFVIIIK